MRYEICVDDGPVAHTKTLRQAVKAVQASILPVLSSRADAKVTITDNWGGGEILTMRIKGSNMGGR